MKGHLAGLWERWLWYSEIKFMLHMPTVGKKKGKTLCKNAVLLVLCVCEMWLAANVGCEIPPWSQLFPSTGICTHMYTQQTQGATHTNAHVKARRFKPLWEQKQRPLPLLMASPDPLVDWYRSGPVFLQNDLRVSAMFVSTVWIPSSDRPLPCKPVPTMNSL